MFFIGIVQAMQEILLPLFATDLGFTITDVGIIVGMASAIAIAALLFLGNYLKRSIGQSLLLFSFLMIAFPLLAPVLTDFMGLIILSGLFLMGRTSGLTMSRSFFSEFSDTHKATIMSVGETIYYFSRSVGSVLAGYTLETVSFDAAFTLMTALTIIVMGGSIALIFAKR